MEPIIYKITLPITKHIDLSESDFVFDSDPSPKLIKYGFNRIIEKLDISTLTNNLYYKTGLNFNFDRTDKNSIREQCKKIFGLKSFDSYKLFCTYWEILNLIELINKNQHILVSDSDIAIFKEIENVHQKLFKSKGKLEFIKQKDKNTANLVFQTYSTIDLDENAYTHLLMNDLHILLSKQTKGSNMVIQLFGIHTQIIVEIIYYLSSLYQEAYIVRPQVSSNLSDEKYLVLINLKSDPKLKYPKISPNLYLANINVGLMPDIYINTIQCMNSELIPSKITTYNTIKTYLDGNVFEGIRYDEMIKNQDSLTESWITTFTDQKKLEPVLEKVLIKSSTECDHAAEFNNLFSLL